MKVLMNLFLTIASVAFCLAPAAAPGLAHHSFAAEFDANLPVSFTGVVTKVDWRNPHIWIYIDATDSEGRVTHWEVEGGAPNSLFRSGWRADSVKPGDRVSVEGFRARRKENAANMRSMVAADGKKLFSGQAAEGR
jgi:hypothetical protein